MTDPTNDVLRDLREYRSKLNAIMYPTLSQLLASAADEIERLLRENEEVKLSWENKHGHPKAT